MHATKITTKLAAVTLSAVALGLTGTAYAATTASTGGVNDLGAASVPVTGGTDAVQAKLNAHRFAVVSADGGLDRGRNAVAVTKITTGAYAVRFDRDITQCGFVASLGQTDIGTTVPGEISTARRFDDTNAVFVDTNDSTGAASDRPFHLTVIC